MFNNPLERVKVDHLVRSKTQMTRSYFGVYSRLPFDDRLLLQIARIVHRHLESQTSYGQSRFLASHSLEFGMTKTGGGVYNLSYR